MIKHYLITGDTHGDVCNRIALINKKLFLPEETAVIILGDAGINFWLGKRDRANKKKISEYGYTIYCVRGNHEERPSNISTYNFEYDKEIDGFVWVEPDFPLIKFLCDGNTYHFNNHPTLILGGAYSIDKYYRLERAKILNTYSGWFPQEQLSQEEMMVIRDNIKNEKVDFVFSHTCPLSWEPVDLFLPFIDQSLVDKSMETWMDEIKDEFHWDTWLFGHYHADRVINPKVRMFYRDIIDLEDLYDNINC